MGNCLVTKLKDSVENPNLPILESMQQFTLDAIARGGNMSMTDDQKYWLNHFFYAIGAINNNALWNKVSICMLPIIGTSRSNCAKDYKDITANLGSTSYVKEQSGCIEVTFGGSHNQTTMAYNKVISPFNTKNQSILIAGEYDISTHNDIYVGLITTYENSKSWATVLNYKNNGDHPLVIKLDGVGTQTININDSTAFLNFVSIGNGKINMYSSSKTEDKSTSNVIAAYPAINTYDSTQTIVGNPSFNMTDGYKIRILLLFNDILTDSERTKIIDAVKKLYNAFVL